MKLIGNNCGTAFIYNKLHKEYNVPFMWNLIFANDFISLIKNFDNINFKNYNFIKLDKNLDLGNHDLSKHPLGLRIDNLFNVFYTHYLYDIKYKTPTSINNDVYYFRNFEYVKEKYDSRLIRMLINKEEPIFIIVAYTFQGWNKELIEKLNQFNKYKIVLLSNIKVNVYSNNTLYIFDPKLNTYPGPAINSHFDKIKSFINV